MLWTTWSHLNHYSNKALRGAFDSDRGASKGSPIDTRFPFLREQKAVTLQLVAPEALDLEAMGVVHASVCVEHVAVDGPAHDVLQVGDCILGVDSQRHSLGGYIERALKTHPEQSKTIVFVRNGVELTATLKLESYTLKDPMAGSVPLWSKGFTLPSANIPPAEDDSIQRSVGTRLV